MMGFESGNLAYSAQPLPELEKDGEKDPIVALYREWLDARREWHELSDLPGNENWDDPRTLAAEAREYHAVEQMLTLAPTSLEGVAALAALAWFYVKPATTDPEELAQKAQSHDCRALMAIWRACTGLGGYPVS